MSGGIVGAGAGDRPRRILVWQWGRRGAGPRVAAEMAIGLGALPGITALLSLSTGAELLRGREAPAVALPVPTYRGLWGFALRFVSARLRRRRLCQAVAALRPDVALCAMPGPLDGEMAGVLRRLGVPFAVVVHDADRHPGDGSALQMALQRQLVRRSAAVVALSGHVASRLEEQGLTRGRPLLRTVLPPFVFGPAPPPLAHGGVMRLLCFGRLLPYKGLDLLAEALEGAGLDGRFALRVVGEGPNGPMLQRLAALPGVTVENRWVPEDEIGALVAWCDAVVLPYREASQSGVAATAIAARRWVVSTRVGGLVEQFRGEDRAILCDPNAAALRRALLRLLDDPPAGATIRTGDGARAAWQEEAARLVEGLGVVFRR